MSIDWSQLHQSIQADLATGNWKTKSYQIGSRRHEFRDVTEILAMLRHIEQQAGIASGAWTGRTYAKPVARH